MQLITRPYNSIEAGIYLSTVDVSNHLGTYIYFICKRSTTTLATSHALPKEINSIWFHVVVLRPLQHVKSRRYKSSHELYVHAKHQDAKICMH